MPPNPPITEQVVAFIGGGNMAGAIVGGLRRQGMPGHLIEVVEPSAQSREQLRACCPRKPSRGLLPWRGSSSCSSPAAAAPGVSWATAAAEEAAALMAAAAFAA